MVRNLDGSVQQSYEFPTLISMFKRLFNVYPSSKFINTCEIFSVPWISGCFMLFNAMDFRRVHGFDSDTMYYEDVDISLFVESKRRVILDPSISILHEGQYQSRKSFRHLLAYS